VVVDRTPPRRGWFKRRITVQSPSLGAWLAEASRAIGRKLRVLAKAAIVVAFVAASVFAVRAVVRHVVASPRFAVHDVRVTFATAARDARVRDDDARDGRRGP
jgi:hypothetical protein